MTALIEQTKQTKQFQGQVEALQHRMIQGADGVFTSFSIYIGHKLGFYNILSDCPAMTSTELASRAKTHERYTREWLEQQATAGIVDVRNPHDGKFERRFSLSPAHAEVLVNRDSVDFLAPLTEILVGVTRPMRNLLDCFRHGGGVAFADYGTDMRNGQAGINRVSFLRELGSKWIPQVEGLEKRLNRPGARIIDVGCGSGWSSIGLALAFPHAHIDAYDLDRASIREARSNAIENGISDRVTFHCEDATTVESNRLYDLFICCETLHDMADPVSALKTARRHLKPQGTALVVDEKVADRFMGEGGDLDSMMYGWSILHCLPVGMADGAECHCGGTGTVMRLPTLERYASDAGFTGVEVLPIENLFFNIYRLHG